MHETHGDQKQIMDDKLAKLFERPGLKDDTDLQAQMKRLGHQCLEMLSEQKRHNQTRKKPFTDEEHPKKYTAELKDAISREHRDRIDLYIVQWVNDSKEQLLITPQTAERYCKEYLDPTIRKYRPREPDTRPADVPDYLVGSIVRCAIDILGKDNCYVPDSDHPSLFCSNMNIVSNEINKMSFSERYNSPKEDKIVLLR